MVESVHFTWALRKVYKVDFSLICLNDHYVMEGFNSALSKCGCLRWCLINRTESFQLRSDHKYFLLSIAVLAHRCNVLIETIYRYKAADKHSKILPNQVTLHVHLVEPDFNWIKIVMTFLLY